MVDFRALKGKQAIVFLFLLLRYDPAPQQAICTFTGVSWQAVEQALQGLETAGLIERAGGTVPTWQVSEKSLKDLEKAQTFRAVRLMT